MRSSFGRLFIACTLLAAFSFCGFAGPQAETAKIDLTISAAISLQNALDEIDSVYHAEHPNVAIHLNLGASGTLERQIEQGAPVDIYISASPAEMNSLESKGLLLPGTRRDLLRNSVVLIVPRGKSNIAGFADLTKPDVKLISIGEPDAVPAGQYAREVLTHYGIYDQLKPKMVLAKDVRQVLQYVATGNADAGIVYATDARITDRVRIVDTAPENSHDPVVYPISVMKDTRHPSAARDVAQFLRGPQAGSIFRKYGFIPEPTDSRKL